MYSDFYFASFLPSFTSNMAVFSPYAFIQPYLNMQNAGNTLYQGEPQNYTTKQNSVKQETENIKRQTNQPENHQQQPIKSKSAKKQQNKSIFHNYQKHLVTTLKQKITIDQVKDFDPEDLCLKQLWYGFVKAKIANRTLLLAVFGEQKSQNFELARYLQKCNLAWILKQFTMIQIKEAQKKIRSIVKEYFENKNLDQELAGRKLPQNEKPVFKHYANYFLTELAQGTLNRRLPKRYKRQMML